MRRRRVGWQINHLDLAPRYAGVLVGITMTAGTLAGVINPLVVAAIVKHQVLTLTQVSFSHFAISPSQLSLLLSLTVSLAVILIVFYWCTRHCIIGRFSLAALVTNKIRRS